MTEKLTFENAIAYRSFNVAGKPDERIDVFIGKPFKLQEEEWACPYRIVGAGKDLNFQVHALDSIQTLQVVWKVIDGTLAGADLELWEGGMQVCGVCSRKLMRWVQSDCFLISPAASESKKGRLKRPSEKAV